jgi:hypothetical protein
MPSIGKRVHELRIDDGESGLTWRVIYRIDPDAILIVHWFDEKTKATPRARDMTMAKKRLPKGWTEGTAQELLGLTDEEAAMVEIRVRLANKVREIRAKKRIIGSTQPRVCKAEQAEASFDMLVRSLLALGVDRKEIGRAIAN